jgi:hypothetical protein
MFYSLHQVKIQHENAPEPQEENIIFKISISVAKKIET